MRKFVAVIASLILLSIITWASAKTAPQEASQTARQALMEMFFSKEPGNFLKHLPTATRTTLEQSGAMANLQQYSMLATQLQTESKNFQTYETGSILVTTENPKTGQKVDIAIENDNLHGDEDDIELSFHTYKDGQPQKSPFMPLMTFSMRTESGIWKLNEISVTIHVPLADPNLLKIISDGMKAHAAAATASNMPGLPAQTTPRTFGNDASTLAAIHTILTAEVTYAATYPTVGYTCTLSDLDGFGGGEPNEHQAMLINSGLASGRSRGYAFSLSACGNTPATSFRLTAAPIGESYGRRAFCTDQSGAIRSSADGSAATCLSNGTPVQ